MSTLRTLWREYGLLTLLIAGAMIGYLLYSQNRDDILAYSLDVIGERLVAMVDGSEAQAAVVARFASFKSHVLGGDMTTAEIETVAANVLNLSDSGARLSETEAAMVLRPAPRPPDAPPPASRPLALAEAPTAPTASALEALGERLGTMIAFQHEVHAAIEEAPAVRQALADHVRFVTDGGLHVIIDPATVEGLPAEGRARLTEAAARLADLERLNWQAHLADTLKVRRARIESKRAVVSALRQAHAGTVDTQMEVTIGQANEQVATLAQIATIESLMHLEAMGFAGVRADSLERIITRTVEAALEAQRTTRSGIDS